ncbi:MAG: hypothetical protein LUH05_02140 [Candidatus Gastranaerophilales bacterium]|nr:hypothetical protein [Candidatus Gastranaerophilales bacterium]
MNIEKLAKHLKEFALDEIEMIAEGDCKTALEHLLNNNKIVFEQGIYKYNEAEKIDFGIFMIPNIKVQRISVKDAIWYFLENYAKTHCTKRTYETYESIFRVNILPFFKNKNLQDLTNDDIRDFYQSCKYRNLGTRRLKNTLTLLNQLIKYFQERGIIDRKCSFQVKRINDKKFIRETDPLYFLSL